MPATAIEPRGRTALVTGATGYLGANLVPRLVHDGWTVRTLARRALPTEWAAATDQVRGDIRNRAAVARALAGVDVVFHLAARITLLARDDEAWDINVRGPATVARCALDAGVSRLVHCSSVHAFDSSRARPRLSETSPRPGADRPLYDRTKAAGEAEVRAVIDDGLDAVIVNPTGVIGPIDPGMSRANAVLRAAARGHLPVAVPGGFDWVDVRDVVDGAIAAVDAGRTGENYLLSGHRATAMQLGRLAAGMNGRVGPLVRLPTRLAHRLAPAGERVGRLWASDVFTPASISTLMDDPVVDRSKAAAELGYRPRPLEDTVRDLVHWFHDTGHLDRPAPPPFR